MDWSADDVLASFQAISNWGRWGPDDDLGTLNLITPDKVRAASALVRSGQVVSAGLDLSTESSPWSKGLEPLVQELASDPTKASFVFERSSIAHHGWERTHLDALAHAAHDGRVYNGRHIDDVIRDGRLAFGSIDRLGDGIVTRGVLLDIARARGVPWLEPTDTITAADLEAATELAGTAVGTGDAVFVRAGVIARAAALGPQDPAARTGLGPDCAPWMHEREVALVATDCPEQAPSRYPGIGPTWHLAALVYMGLALLDAAAMEPLVDACATRGRSEFLLAVAPLRIPGGSGSVCNPMCVF